MQRAFDSLLRDVHLTLTTFTSGVFVDPKSRVAAHLIAADGDFVELVAFKEANAEKLSAWCADFPSFAAAMEKLT